MPDALRCLGASLGLSATGRCRLLRKRAVHHRLGVLNEAVQVMLAEETFCGDLVDALGP